MDRRKEVVRKFLLEAYDVRIQFLCKQCDDALAAIKIAENEKQKVMKLRADLEHNLGRANEQDIGGIHFLFTGEEGRP